MNNPSWTVEIAKNILHGDTVTVVTNTATIAGVVTEVEEDNNNHCRFKVRGQWSVWYNNYGTLGVYQ